MPKIIQKKFTYIFLLILLLFFISNRTLFFKQSWIENFASNITYPILWLSNKIATPIKNYSEKKETLLNLSNKVQSLENINNKLINENIKLNALLTYQNNTKELLEFQDKYNLKNILLAKIIAKNISNTEHYFLLNKGEKDGIKQNMLAIYKLQIIGRISEVFPWYSKLILITDHTCKISAYANNTSTEGIVIGTNKLNKCKMEYVSHLSKVELEDFVISSGQGLIFPEGFCLGKITKIKTEELYHKIKLTPLVDFSKLDYCLIINQEKLSLF